MDLVRSGRALLLRESPGAKPHLWFVLTEPEGDPPQVVVVMLRTKQRFTDPTLILAPGDHPFVRHESSVHYSTAKWLSVASLGDAFRTGHCSLQSDMSADLLLRVRQALLRSPFTVNVVREHCRGCFGPTACADAN